MDALIEIIDWRVLGQLGALGAVIFCINKSTQKNAAKWWSYIAAGIVCTWIVIGVVIFDDESCDRDYTTRMFPDCE